MGMTLLSLQWITLLNSLQQSGLLPSTWTRKLTASFFCHRFFCSSLPELIERKKTIDMHTNIATELLDHIKTRKLDLFFEMEDKIISRTSLVRHSQLIVILSCDCDVI